MLSPEVWNFEPPQSHFKHEIVDIQRTTEVCSNIIKHHSFNHLVSVVLPNTLTVPEPLIEALSVDTDYYRISDVPVSELVVKGFIDSFIKKGHLTLLSDKTRIDVDNCVAVVPTSCLILSLEKEKFQELGLEGKPSFLRKPNKFIVRINLSAEEFRPGKKNYERVKWCLENQPDLKFDLLLAWDPPEEQICPSSVAAYFSSRGYKVSACEATFSKKTSYNVQVPLIDDSAAADPSGLLEWLGELCLGADLDSGRPDDYLSTYQVTMKKQHYGQVTRLQWNGFFTVEKILNFFSALRTYAMGREDVPWISVHVSGFVDSPVNWGMKENYFYTSGDNHYTLFIRNDGKVLVSSFIGVNKRCKK